MALLGAKGAKVDQEHDLERALSFVNQFQQMFPLKALGTSHIGHPKQSDTKSHRHEQTHTFQVVNQLQRQSLTIDSGSTYQ